MTRYISNSDVIFRISMGSASPSCFLNLTMDRHHRRHIYSPTKVVRGARRQNLFWAFIYTTRTRPCCSRQAWWWLWRVIDEQGNRLLSVDPWPRHVGSFPPGRLNFSLPTCVWHRVMWKGPGQCVILCIIVNIIVTGELSVLLFNFTILSCFFILKKGKWWYCHGVVLVCIQ